ncbi:nitrilase-related carbon-nitrogen hydrolase [Ruania albidiflava]|uniref:nitrilase-related carbon-nitrogen hydrolase n=1 Tax=Ruania albidiflava TaxID=366586 RepID=UPI0003B2FBDE|nr:nitrilase-related carbon-nitrogen hydrolase [Ruania albidiflava]
MRLPVAVVQLAAGADAAAAAERSAAAVRDAARGGAHLVVLPEYASGWAPRLTRELAQPRDGLFLTAVRAAAAEVGVWVVAGTMVPTGAQGRCENLAVLVGPDGQVVGEYRKVHLFDAFGVRESDLLDGGPPGAGNLLTAEVGGLRIGVATCYDLRFPEIFRLLADSGVQVLVVIAAWADGPGKVEQLEVLARSRALENTSYLLLASQPGEGRVGRSAVISPWGTVIDQGAANDAVILHSELDADAVAQARTTLPSLIHRQFHVVPGAPGSLEPLER